MPFLKYHTSSTIYELKLILDSIDNLKKRSTIPFLNKFLSLILTKTQKYKASRHFLAIGVRGSLNLMNLGVQTKGIKYDQSQ